MVFLSEASIREMVQEALGGGGYPTLDGDGNFPIVPSPLAEPIVTKLALQPVRVMRIPTDRTQFELAVKELVDGVEQDHLPTLFLKLRELVADFVPPELESSPCPHDCSPKDDHMSKQISPDSDEMMAIRTEVRRLVRTILDEADRDEKDEEDPVAYWRPGGKGYRRPRGVYGLGALPSPLEKDVDPTAGDDWEDDVSMDDVGAAEPDPASDPYPQEYLADPGYPPIGDEEEAWDDLEREIARSAWEPESSSDRNSELDRFRGRDIEGDLESNAAEHVPDRKGDTISKVKMTLADIQKDPEFAEMGQGSLHGMIAKAARKLRYTARELTAEEVDDMLDDATDAYIEKLIQAGSEKDEETGKPLLSMSDVMELRSGYKGTETDSKGREVKRKLDDEGENIRKALQGTDTFREFLHHRIVKMMQDDDYAYSHQDAAKDKEKSSVIHLMKKTTK